MKGKAGTLATGAKAGGGLSKNLKPIPSFFVSQEKRRPLRRTVLPERPKLPEWLWRGTSAVRTRISAAWSREVSSLTSSPCAIATA